MKKKITTNKLQKDTSMSLRIEKGDINDNKRNTIQKEEKNDNLILNKDDLIKQLKQKNLLFKKIFNNLKRKKLLEIIKKNKKVPKWLDIDLKDYKEYNEKYSEIEIEIIPAIKKYGKFINIKNPKEESFFIYILMIKKKKLKLKV